MSEDLGTVINRGFETWKHNLNLSLPFILELLASALFAALVSLGVVVSIGIDEFLKIAEQAQPILESVEQSQEPPVMEAAAIAALIKPYLSHLLLAFLILIVGMVVIKAFFKAGAIGMARMATEKGTASLADMVHHGKHHVVNLFLAEVLLGLIMLAGVVFLLPAALFSPSGIAEGGHVGLLLLGAILWVAYLLVVSITFAVMPYALVIDAFHPLDALKKSIDFFMAHKLEVILLLLLAISLSFGTSILLGSIPFIGGILNTLVALIVIEPLILLWWTRLYMANTGKSLYVNELLLHPRDLPKTL